MNQILPRVSDSHLTKFVLKMYRGFSQKLKNIRINYVLKRINKFILSEKQSERITQGHWDIYIVRMKQGIIINCFCREMFKICHVRFGGIYLQLEWYPNITIYRSDMNFVINSLVHDYQEALKSFFEYEDIYCSLLNIDMYHRKRWQIRQPNQSSGEDLASVYYSLGDRIHIFNRLKQISMYNQKDVREFMTSVSKIDFDIVFEEIRILGKHFRPPLVFLGPIFFGFLVDKIVEVLYSYLAETWRIQQFKAKLVLMMVDQF